MVVAAPNAIRSLHLPHAGPFRSLSRHHRQTTLPAGLRSRTAAGGLQQQARGAALAARASSGGEGPASPPPQPPASSGDSDLAFVAKLVAVSFALGAVIKYGSLWLDAPFEADPRLALTLVAAPPLAYAGYLLVRQQQEGPP